MARGLVQTQPAGYVTGARSLLRLMWFLDFVCTLLAGLLQNPASELRPTASRAYDAALANHHPWLLRKAIGAAMLALPSRATFMRNISAGEDMSVLTEDLGEFVRLLEQVRLELWRFYSVNGLTELP